MHHIILQHTAFPSSPFHINRWISSVGLFKVHLQENHISELSDRVVSSEATPGPASFLSKHRLQIMTKRSSKSHDREVHYLNGLLRCQLPRPRDVRRVKATSISSGILCGGNHQLFN